MRLAQISFFRAKSVCFTTCSFLAGFYLRRKSGFPSG
nr:MAG TPA: hypothetical protein [Caudoviricetes sp.]